MSAGRRRTGAGMFAAVSLTFAARCALPGCLVPRYEDRECAKHLQVVLYKYRPTYARDHAAHNPAENRAPALPASPACAPGDYRA